MFGLLLSDAGFTRIYKWLLFFFALSCFEGLFSRFREFWSRTSNCCNLLFRKDKLALMNYDINVTMRIDTLTPLAKISVFRGAENNEAITEISGNLLKSHHEVILIYLASPLIAILLCLTTCNLCDQVVEVKLLHAMHLSSFLIIEGSAIQLLVAEQIWLDSLDLWFNNAHLMWFLGFNHQLWGCVLEAHLCVIVSWLIGFPWGVNMLLNKFRSVLVLHWSLDGSQKRNNNFGWKILDHVLIAYLCFN